MSTQAQADAPALGATGHGSHHNVHSEPGQGHGTFRSYMTGFVLSVVLTAIPFWLVMSGIVGSSVWTAIIVMAFAVAQIFVHMVYFLHMNGRSEGGWNMMALIFTLVLVVITLTGSLWVMYHLNVNMMPAMQEMNEMGVHSEKAQPVEGGHHAIPQGAPAGAMTPIQGDRPMK